MTMKDVLTLHNVIITIHTKDDEIDKSVKETFMTHSFGDAAPFEVLSAKPNQSNSEFRTKTDSKQDFCGNMITLC